MLQNLNTYFSNLLIKSNLITHLTNNLINVTLLLNFSWNLFNNCLNFSINLLQHKGTCFHVILHLDLKCLWFVLLKYLEFIGIAGPKFKDSLIKINLFEIRDYPFLLLGWLDQFYPPLDSIHTITRYFTKGIEVDWLRHSKAITNN